MDSAGRRIHLALHRHVVAGMVLQGVRIVHRKHFVVLIGYEYHLLTGGQALLGALFALGIRALSSALGVCHPTLNSGGFGGFVFGGGNDRQAEQQREHQKQKQRYLLHITVSPLTLSVCETWVFPPARSEERRVGKEW